jgi:hypothetical protein
MNNEMPTRPSLPGNCDFGRGTVLHHVEQRNDALRRKKNVRQLMIGFVD